MAEDSHEQPEKRVRRTNRTVDVGLASNIILAVLKLAAGIFGHSRALLADGINSTSDVVYYVIVKIFTAIAGRPADVEHPYGHRQMESIASVIVGAFVLTTAVAIFWDSINSAFDLLTGQREAPAKIELITLWVALGTIAAKIALTIYTRNSGRKTHSSALFALARDHRNDIFSSVGAAIGIVLGRMGLEWVDPLAGAVVALVIMHTGIEILRESSADLMDTVPGEEMDQQIRETLAPVSEIKEIEDIRAHRFGPYFVVNITIGIDGNMSVARGDAIANEVEERLFSSLELLQTVYVHYHPSRKNT